MERMKKERMIEAVAKVKLRMFGSLMKL